MRLVDWRSVPASVIEACYAREARHWRDAFAWETSRSWRTIEEARVKWGLPGYLALGVHDQVHGWTCFHAAGDVLQVGALVGRQGQATRLLIRAAKEQAVACGARCISCFLPVRTPGLVEALDDEGFAVTPHSYLSRPLVADDAGPGDDISDWRGDEVDAAARLLRDAYGPEGIHFAAHGRADEWRRYVNGLVVHEGCGVLDPRSSCAMGDDGELSALAIVTTIAGDTAHLAQMAVAPRLRGRGVATRLLEAVLSRAARQGRRRITLLAADDNPAAQALYARCGFQHGGRFVAAWRG
jgi:ribosomal protein S18 acetylase RimI-like enzyme